MRGDSGLSKYIEPLKGRKNVLLQGNEEDSKVVIKRLERRINSWKPSNEMLPLKHGGTVSMVVTGISGMLVATKLINAFKVRATAGRIVGRLPGLLGLPCAYFAVEDYILPAILTNRFPCPVCLQLRSGLFQIGSGVVYPLLVSTFAVAHIARQYPKAYYGDLKGTATQVYNMLKKNRTFFSILLVTNFAAASGLTYLQQDAYYKLIAE